MIKVYVKTNGTRRDVTAAITESPSDVFERLEVSTSGTAVNLNGSILTLTELNSSFESLGVDDGSTVSLHCIVKADGGNE